MKQLVLFGLIALCACTLPAFARNELKDDLRFAELGDFQLESGERIRNCRIGYRTLGTLNADKSNAILFPTWFSGKSEQLRGNFGPGRMVDTDRFFVIAVDAIGNGVSSSPTNSSAQAGEAFPRFTIRDMVNSQHHLLTRILGINHLSAVIGISMGGMQTFQWITSYPDFMDRAIPIIGTTMQTSYDLMLWEAQLRAIDAARRGPNNEIDVAAAARTVAHIHGLALFTPRQRNALTPPAEFQKFMATEEENYVKTFKPLDWASQLRAMMSHDISRPFDGSWERTAAAVKAKVLVIAATQDHMVNPDPAFAFARLIRAQTLELHSDCGHMATSCEAATVTAVVRHFLNQ